MKLVEQKEQLKPRKELISVFAIIHTFLQGKKENENQFLLYLSSMIQIFLEVYKNNFIQKVANQAMERERERDI